MMSYSEALSQIQKIAREQSFQTELVLTEEAVGRILAEDLLVQETQPQFHLSAMDGFAVKVSETLLANSDQAAKFKILKSIAAGDLPSIETDFSSPAVAVEIMTGAVVPAVFNAVVRVEDTQVTHNELQIFKPLREFENIRQAGSDFNKGKLLLSQGTKIIESHIMGLAAQGISHISVVRRPKVAILNTGKEIVPFTKESLEPGQVRNSSGPLMKSFLKKYSCELLYYQQIPDDPKMFFELMQNLLEQEPELILTTGAVSMGVYDFIKSVLTDLRVNILFHKVAIRPGKPLLFATYGKTAIFSIPGNPISTAVAMRFFIEPFLQTFQKQNAETVLQLPLAQPVKKPFGLTCFYKAALSSIEFQNQKISAVDASLDQGSAVISSFLQTQYWVVLLPEKTQFQAGEVVNVYNL